MADGHVRMGIAKNAEDVDKGFQIVHSFPKFRNLPIMLSESDPEGCAACSARVYPQNAYRNGPLYASYTAAMMKNIFELADREKTNIAGMLTWAFEFEDQPYFDGFRTLATNGIDKPVLNVFRMAGMMRGDRVKTESSGAVASYGHHEARRGASNDVDALAVRSDRQISVLAWNYHDDDLPGPEAKVQLEVTGGSGRRRPRPAASLPDRRDAQQRLDSLEEDGLAAEAYGGAIRGAGGGRAVAVARIAPLDRCERRRMRSWISCIPRQGVSLIQMSW